MSSNELSPYSKASDPVTSEVISQTQGTQSPTQPVVWTQAESISPRGGAPVQAPTQTPAGWYPDTVPHHERWWDGHAWTEATRPVVAAPAPVAAAPTIVVQQHLTMENSNTSSNENINANENTNLSAAGLRVGMRKREHLVHIFLTLATGGLWLPIYLIRYLSLTGRIRLFR